MIHYHGTPITPREKLLNMGGRNFCVPFTEGRNLMTCIRIGASVMLDNGAFSAWTRGITINWESYYLWAEDVLQHPHWAVIPDVIDGGEEDNDSLIARCRLPKEWSAPVWHLHESLERLARLSDSYPKICFGSSGEFSSPGNDKWTERIDSAWNMIERTGRKPWVHMLRAMSEAASGRWPFASADSTNIARNHNGSSKLACRNPEDMAQEIDSINPRRRARIAKGVES